MRKLIAIPLLVLYITAISGMMIQLHYCGSKLLSWNVNKANAKCCCESAEKNSKHALAAQQIKSRGDDCCKNKTITLKIQQDQNRANELHLQLNALQIAAPAVYSTSVTFLLPAAIVHTAYQANAPPGRWQQIPLYLLHGSFTYYG